MKEIFPLCARTLDPEQILLQRDRSPKESTLQARAFAEEVNARGFDKGNTVKQIRHGVVKRTRKTD